MLGLTFIVGSTPSPFLQNLDSLYNTIFVLGERGREEHSWLLRLGPQVALTFSDFILYLGFCI